MVMLIMHLILLKNWKKCGMILKQNKILLRNMIIQYPNENAEFIYAAC